MTVSVAPPFFYYLPNNNNTGAPAAGFKLFTYIANTSTKQATWVDSTQTTQNDNPILLDANGFISKASGEGIWFDPTLSYKCVLALPSDTDPPSSPIRTLDNVQGPITLATLTAGLIGSILYPQTAAEIAASVTPTNLAKWPAPLIDPIRYGMKADGVTDDHVAYNNALLVAAQSGGYVQLPAGNILIGSAYAHPANVLIAGAGQHATRILRGFTGDLVTSVGSYGAYRDLTIDGQTGTWGNGNGINFAGSTNNQSLTNVEVTQFNQACLKFANDAAHNFSMVGGVCFTTGVTGTQGAIVFGTDTPAASRSFVNVESGGCTLFDFGSCDDVYVCGGFSNGWIFGSGSSKVCIVNSRIGNTGTFTTLTINGSAHQISHVPSAVPVVVNGSNHVIEIQAPSWNITDNSTGSSILILDTAYTPSWTSSGTAPALGNGSISGRYTRRGNRVSTDIMWAAGSTTTFGTGTWQFSLPFAPYNPGGGITTINGPATLQHGGTYQVATAVSNPATSYVNLFPHGAGGAVTNAVPWAWGNGDFLYIHIEYQVP